MVTINLIVADGCIACSFLNDCDSSHDVSQIRTAITIAVHRWDPSYGLSVTNAHIQGWEI